VVVAAEHTEGVSCVSAGFDEVERVKRRVLNETSATSPALPPPFAGFACDVIFQ
jgi:hypothetical protein